VTKKKKGETSKTGKFYHNTTSYYNGYWNATELLRLNLINMKAANIDDYNSILEVEDYINLPNPKMVDSDMNKAIEKVTVVYNIHEPGDWIDDCYVLMAKAQYYKQDYETAEKTLQYFQEVFNPKNPYGKNYFKSPLNKKKLKKLKEKQKKEEKALKEKAKKEKEEIKEEEAKVKEKTKKQKAKEKEKAKKQRAKEREKAKKNKTKQTTTPVDVTPAEPKIENKPKSSEAKTVAEEPKDKKVKEEKDKTAYNEGLLWLAKTHIKRQNYFSAEFLLNKLDKTTNLNKKVRKELPAAFANLYIKQKKYTEAIAGLKKAIKEEKQRELRARYAFIIGQLNEKNNDYAGAMTFYKIAKKKSRNEKMVLMANMAMITNTMLAGVENKSETIKTLEKLLKEDKYADQMHVIYYTMAKIELADANLEGAITYFQQSLNNNTSDNKLRTDVYYIIATALFEKEKFYESKLYYDSTKSVMNKIDKRYFEVETRAKNLIDIAKNIEIINHQDTLLYLSELTGDEQKKELLSYAKHREGSKTPEKSKKVNGININATKPEIKSNKFTEDFGTSSFFAYNKETRDKGVEAFQKKWGRNIQLQDNWRMSSKAKEFKGASEDNREAVLTENQKQKELEESPEYKNLIKELPQNPVQKKEAQEKLIDAMFELGKLYRNVLEKYTNSIDVLEKMHTRFGPTKHELESYYYLVLNYRDLSNKERAEEYSSKLIRKYPESSYAKILSDPDYLAALSKEASKVDKYYEETYSLFSKGNYKITLERIKSLKDQFGEENKYSAKLALMYAMCLGNTDGRDAYIKALNDVIIAFPNTPEQTKAREILRYLTGDVQAFSTIGEEESLKLYNFDETKPHFVAIVTYGLSEMQFVDAKISISEFNKTHFKLEKLQMTDAMLNKPENAQVIVIKKFSNAKEAMVYYNKVTKLQSEYITLSANYEVFPISQPNYLKMLGQYSSKAYRFFFEKNYKELK
jgi:tetratricopeptide (TPR) repeat protein